MFSKPPAMVDRDSTSIPEDATCLKCRYSLRGLQTSRCPECGTLFDPADPESFRHKGHRLRLMRVIVSPSPAASKRWIVRSCAMIAWGSALLPGGMYVCAVGWICLILTCLYGIGHAVLADSLASFYELPDWSAPRAGKCNRWELLLVFVAMTSPILSIPLRVALILEWPFIHSSAVDSYYVEPMIYPPATPRIEGGLIVIHIDTHFHGVSFTALGGGHLYWICPEDRASIRTWQSSDPYTVTELLPGWYTDVNPLRAFDRARRY